VRLAVQQPALLAGGDSSPRLTDQEIHELNAFLRFIVAHTSAAHTSRGCVEFICSTDRQDLTVFELVLSELFALASYHELVLALGQWTSNDVNDFVADIATNAKRTCYASKVLKSSDGTRLRAHFSGRCRDEALVLVIPCGMSVGLAEEWLRQLCEQFFVVTWESRGMFPIDGYLDSCALDMTAQVQDLVAVIDGFGIRSAHVMGFCGGAVIALRAAYEEPDKIKSLSLWHGDYELGELGPKSEHQRNLQALMASISSDLAVARSVHELFTDSDPPDVRKEFAHYVVYPYCTPELLYRYSKLNGTIMETNVAPILDDIKQPTLVVTSNGDETTHPEASRYVASRLQNATVVVLPKGDHLTLFEAAPATISLAARFVRTLRNPLGIEAG
jgi:3-oxoadipate enol-lactonase